MPVERVWEGKMPVPPASALERAPGRGRGFLRFSWVVLFAASSYAGLCPARAQEAPQDSPRDFPPARIAIPAQPTSEPADTTAPVASPTFPQVTGTPVSPIPPFGSAAEGVYRIGVGDELSIEVIGEPQLSRVVRVLPDGSMQYPGVGSIYVLGKTPDEATGSVRTGLARLLRYPDVQLIVNSFGEQRIYVMGEVEIPGDHPYHKGASTLGAIAQAGGFKASAQRSQVLVFRRSGPDLCEVTVVDVKAAMDASAPVGDLLLRPFDIVHVPKTWIANVNVFVDQWIRQNISVFTMYLAGWDAFNASSTRTVIRSQ